MPESPRFGGGFSLLDRKNIKRYAKRMPYLGVIAMNGPVIYWIKNRVNGKFYVGSTTQRHVRWRTHRTKLRAGTHHCRHLQAAWDKYGGKNFQFAVVERVLDGSLLEAAEDRWLVEHVGKPHCYNHGRSSKAPWRGTLGMGLSPMTGKKLSKSAKAALREAAFAQWKTADPRTGRKHSAEAKEKISAKVRKAVSEGRGGCFIPSEETRRKMSEALKGNQSAKGYKRTDAEKRAISERMKGNQTWAGRKYSEESKEKMGRPVRMISPEGDGTVYPRTTAIKDKFGIFLPTIQRSVRSGKPLAKGPYKGWRFEYV